jgi:hypothetical protein
MSRKVNVHVGTMEEMGRRFVSAWRRLENGDVDTLSSFGLLVRDEPGSSARYDVIQADFDLRVVATFSVIGDSSDRR